jgi:hypothetical protein
MMITLPPTHTQYRNSRRARGKYLREGHRTNES